MTYFFHISGLFLVLRMGITAFSVLLTMLAVSDIIISTFKNTKKDSITYFNIISVLK